MAANVLLVHVLLLSVRLAPTLAFTPILASVPPLVRVALVIGLSTSMVAVFPQGGGSFVDDGTILSEAAVLIACVREVALGLTLALGVQLAFAAPTMAGQILSLQMGFGLAQAIDPVSNRQTPVMTTLLNQLAVVAFFAGNGHHAVLRGIGYSLSRFPLGAQWPLEAGWLPVGMLLLATFALGFALAAPVVMSLFMLDLALGVLARSLPQINMIAFGIPIKIVVGLLVFTAWVGGIGEAFERLYDTLFRAWDSILAMAGTSVHFEPIDSLGSASPCTKSDQGCWDV